MQCQSVQLFTILRNKHAVFHLILLQKVTKFSAGENTVIHRVDMICHDPGLGSGIVEFSNVGSVHDDRTKPGNLSIASGHHDDFR